MTVAMPLHWRLGLWGLILLCANTVAKAIASHHIGNPDISHPIRICLALMILYFIIQIISIAYSNQTTEAISTVTTMLPLLLFPMLFLISDTHYLNRRHLSFLSYLLAAILTLRFIVMLIRSHIHHLDSQLFADTTNIFATILVQIASWFSHISPFPQLNNQIAIQPILAVAHLFNNTPFEHLPTFVFDPLHHNYLSLYILTAIALLYSELVHHWRSPRWHFTRWFVILDIALLSLYILLNGSRSGMVAWVLLATACLAHLTFCRKRWCTVGIILATTTLIIGLSYWASPKTFNHITSTIHNIQRGDKGDIRQTMWQSGIDVAKGHPLFGYGCDGYWDVLFQQYRAHDCHSANVNQFSTHNQYLETTLSTGLVGLCILLAMLLTPVMLAYRRPSRNLPMFLFTVAYAPCLFFETTFGRQMGILFIGFWYCLLLLYSRPQLQPSSYLPQ